MRCALGFDQAAAGARPTGSGRPPAAAPARPGRSAPGARPGCESAAQAVAQRARAAVARRQVELAQVPQRARGLQHALLVGQHQHAASRASARPGRPRPGARSSVRAGRPIAAAAARASAALHTDCRHAVGVRPGQLHRRSRVGAERRREVAERRVVGPRHRHDAIDLDAGLFERLRARRQPGLVEQPRPRCCGRPQRRVRGPGAALRVRRAAASSSTPASAARSRAARRLGQRDAVPADVGVGEHRHHGVGLGQQRGGRAAVLRHGQPVGASAHRSTRPLAARAGATVPSALLGRRARAGNWMTRVDMVASEASANGGCRQRYLTSKSMTWRVYL